MRVAFWSSAQSNSGVTSNLACISIATAMEYSYKSVMIENHYQKNKLENILMYNLINYQLREECNYQFRHIGMDYIINQFASDSFKIKNQLRPYRKLCNKDDTNTDVKSQVIEEASLEVFGNSVYFIPNNYLTNQETFDYNLYSHIDHILSALDGFADITFIDTSNQNNLSSKVILEEVDLVVVNLLQNSSMIEYFFDNYSSILSKCVFLISSYRKKTKLNVNKISKTHSINKSNIATIPYNVEYQDAVSQGRVVEFISRNYTCKRNNPNYHFVFELKKAVNMIIRNAELISHKEDII